ncbi:MAG: hypothetical protein N3B12_04165 [Armatimonadetes bacterium]|nr:hypothetical protein [Armatimonadota bacterium]
MASNILQGTLRDPKSRPASRGVLAQVLSRLPSQKKLWVAIELKSAKGAEKGA